MISFGNGSGGINLKNPEFDDVKAEDIGLSVKTMMDSSVVTHVTEPRTTFRLEFKELSRPKAEELRDFFDDTTGQRLTYVDIAGTAWSGFIINREINLDNTGRGRGNLSGTMRKESFTATIEFEVADANSNT